MIEIENLHVRFNSEKGEVHAVRGVSVNVAAGEFYTLLGPSGCGKTTTLRCLAGLETPSEGKIAIGDVVVHNSENDVSVPTFRRDIGMVFQSYAIWPHLTVFENVAFPLREMRQKKIPEAQIQERVKNALELVQLSGYETRPAPFLSGGQQQRLALARAIVREASVVLFDEPLSNLDAKLRAETRLELRRLVKRLGMTALYVTHDQTEALTMADRVAIMRDGVIVQEATPTAIYKRPKSRFVASFIGQCSFVEGTIVKTPTARTAGKIDTKWGPLVYTQSEGHQKGDTVTVAVRPENVRLGLEKAKGAKAQLTGEISEIVFLGEALECKLNFGEAELITRLHPSCEIAMGDKIDVSVMAEDVTILAD